MPQPREPVTIAGIAFDALMDATESREADAPAYPTEAGFEVSDAIILRPLTLSMSLYLTNTPVSWQQRASPHRVQDVVGQLRRLYFSREPVCVRTQDADYANMAILSISLPKKLETGSSYVIDISFQQIQTTERRTASIPTSCGRGGQSGASVGIANTVTAPAPQADSEGSRGSILFNLTQGGGLVNSLGGIMGGFLPS